MYTPEVLAASSIVWYTPIRLCGILQFGCVVYSNSVVWYTPNQLNVIYPDTEMRL